MTSAENTTKTAIARRVHRSGQQLIDLSHRIHTHPELGFAEEQASTWVAEILATAGFAVTRGCYGLPTAVHATVGTGPLHIGICAEYDALPDIGHACGHNIIASAAVGAGLGLAEVVDELGLTVTVLGTPAEEGGGGKVLMLDRGAFEGIDAAMMVHPGSTEIAAMPGSAISQFEVVYQGRSAHAGAHPELGINAADAIVLAQNALGLLRQHIRTADKVQGIVIEAGTAPGIIPETSRGRWIVRSDTAENLAALKTRVLRCFEAGALATGSTLSTTPTGPDYAELKQDETMLALYRANAEALGRSFSPAGPPVGVATDMGNVSHAVPTIHPMLDLNCPPAVNHQPEFTAACITSTADRACLDGAIAMAWTATDLATTRTNPE